MKKYASVFSLYIRSNFYKVTGIILLMSVFQILKFRSNLTCSDAISPEGYLLGFENILDIDSLIHILFGAAFIAVTIILCFFGTETVSKQGYTLRRLNITEKQVLVCQAAANTFMYSLLLLSQIVISFILAKWYYSYAGTQVYPYDGVISNQALFLAYYRNLFLHSLLPMDDFLRHIANALSIIGMGITSAAFPYFSRRKKLSLEVFFLMVIILMNFLGDWQMYTYDLILMGTSAFFSGLTIVRISQEDKAYEK